MRFRRHYTREEAQALLPHVRLWLRRLVQLRVELEKHEHRLVGLMQPGKDFGGELVNNWVRTLGEINEVQSEFFRREIQVKDIERGLLDFPAIIDGQEVFLCWEKDEEDIEFWHDLDSGYAGREPL